MKKLIYILAIVPILLTSCMGLNTTPYVNNPITTSVDLSNGNFKVVKIVTGEVTGKYVFGIGGRSQKVLKSNAIAEMYKTADLQGSQAIVNVTVSTSTKSVLGALVLVRTATATGYVVEFDGPRCPNCEK